MFDNGGSGPGRAQEIVQRLLTASGTDSVLARRLSDAQAAFLVLDADGTRILHASPAALALRRAIADPDGRLDPALRIGDGIARARPLRDTPLLLRLTLDRRRIAPPVTMTLLRAADDAGPDLLVLLANAPLPRLRPRPDSVPGEADATAPANPDTTAPAPSDAPLAPEPLPLAPRLGQRFTWRSDASGAVTELSPPAGDLLRTGMLGRTWADLAGSGALRDADGLIVALNQGRTFRAIPVALRTASGTVFDLELSGSPVDRQGRDFRGFGQVRSITDHPPEEPAAASAEAPTHGEGPAAPVGDAVPDPVQGSTDLAAPAEAEGSTVPASADVSASAPADGPAPDADVELSSHEHAAFREIARALGARFAGDEAPTPGENRGLPCAVMPFPASALRPPEAGTPEPDASLIATLDRLPAGVLVYRENAILFANRRLLDLTGHADAAALDASGGIGGLFRGLAPHARESNETPIVLAARDGRRIGVLVEHSVVDWAGRPAELLLARDAASGDAARSHRADGLARDVADRRGADALAVLDALDDGIATLDEQGRLLTLNGSAAALFDVDPREVVGSSLLSLFAPENAVDLLARLHAEPGAPRPDPVRVKSRGTGRDLQVRVLPLGDDPPNRACAVIADASEPGRREAASLQASDVLARLNREIRTPIDGILGLADRMLAEPSPPASIERHREKLRDIHAAGSHVLGFIDDLLDLARIEAGHLDLAVAEIPLNEVVTRCVSLLQPQASRERIVLRTSFSADLAPLMADERSVRQATLNVIANAIAFTQAGGQVIVSTSMADRGEIALRVRDTGIGMTADEVDAALDPFRPAPAPASRRGTGLGLPLTKALVEANHGRLRIESRKDEGTLVEMLFPADALTKRA